MSDQCHQEKHRNLTKLPSLELIELSQDDAHDYYQLVDRNRHHVTRHGDYLDMKKSSMR